MAYYLLSSLEPEDEGVEEAWRKEIARRVTGIKNGIAIGRPGEEVLVAGALPVKRATFHA